METLLSVGFNPYFTAGPIIEKVLIVEDEPLWQLLIERALRRINKGIEVRFSKNANQALEVLSGREDFDFIIADHLLEGAKTGLDLWDILLKQKTDIPYILLSGTRRSDFFSRLMPYRTEMVPRFIEKAGTVRELSEQLSEAMFSHRSRL